MPKKRIKQVLFITAGFPPNLSIGTIRPYKFAKYLDCFGWEVTVLAQGYKNKQINLDESLIDELPVRSNN